MDILNAIIKNRKHTIKRRDYDKLDIKEALREFVIDSTSS